MGIWHLLSQPHLKSKLTRSAQIQSNSNFTCHLQVVSHGTIAYIFDHFFLITNVTEIIS